MSFHGDWNFPEKFRKIQQLLQSNRVINSIQREFPSLINTTIPRDIQKFFYPNYLKLKGEERKRLTIQSVEQALCNQPYLLTAISAT